MTRRRRCGCRIGSLGLDLHLSGIRSHEKLTGEGVTFLGDELHTLLEEVLPATLGGEPLDYQLVEEERGALTRVILLVSPQVGHIEEERAVETVLSHLAASPGGVIMAGEWRRAGTLQVERRIPYPTAAGKILPLHIMNAPPG